MKNIIVTGAAGFAGYNLCERLSERGYKVFAIIRPNSEHNERLKQLNHVKLVECDMAKFDCLSTLITENVDFFFHMAWSGGRYDFNAQMNNLNMTLTALEQAKLLGCSRFIAAGSQAEYGVVDGLITEDILPQPFCDYGAAKVATCYLSKKRAAELEIDWIWGRIFSLYGKYEQGNRMLPYMYNALKDNKEVNLSSCEQYWDYLYATDAADAFIALAEKGKNGQVYNVANGNYRRLKEFAEETKSILGSTSKIVYGENPSPFVSLQPSVKKIQKDTGWTPLVSFEMGIEKVQQYAYGLE